jgi:hypothetical protein
MDVERSGQGAQIPLSKSRECSKQYLLGEEVVVVVESTDAHSSLENKHHTHVSPYHGDYQEMR